MVGLLHGVDVYNHLKAMGSYNQVQVSPRSTRPISPISAFCISFFLSLYVGVLDIHILYLHLICGLHKDVETGSRQWNYDNPKSLSEGD